MKTHCNTGGSTFGGLQPWLWKAGLLAMLLFTGCATQDAREHAEGVAKGWCETIRASQIIPVYPLTEDLRVGDVFLVRTPIATQEKEYKEKGFLALDDHRHRLPYTNFTSLYSDGYFRDEFGRTPHALLLFTNSGSIQSNTPLHLENVPVPRVAFPTYSFKAQSGYGLSAAFPIQGVPVALGYLGTDEVNGSVSISDARSYGGDESELLEELTTWANTNRTILAQTARNSSPQPVFLRVVSRVFLARSMEVTLSRSNDTKAAAHAGFLDDTSILNTNSLNPTYTNVLSALTAQAVKPLGAAAQVGARVNFTSASKSTIGLAQNFDRLLVVGYHGLDVPVFENGDLGAPVPTFSRLNNHAVDWIQPSIQLRSHAKHLKYLAEHNPTAALMLVSNVAAKLQSSEFELIPFRVRELLRKNSEIQPKDVKRLVRSFHWSRTWYVASPNLFRLLTNPQRAVLFNSAFAEAFQNYELAATRPSPIVPTSPPQEATQRKPNK